jgi:tRNA-specific 2-thiouridylase
MKKKVIVAMSGGVDSSVAACVLLREGYEVVGVTMKTYAFDDVGGNAGNETSCCGLDAFNDARRVAVHLGVPHYVADFTREFESDVIENFAEEYLKGRTPNPCVICNRTIKWGALLRKAEALGADFLATGHYARTGYDPASGRHRILRARHRPKDQSYALWGLGQGALSKTLFPLGDLTKEEVREIARLNGLPTAEKEESFEICFVADNDYRRFIAERQPLRLAKIPPGEIVRDGKRVGVHRGYPYYTIGQRSGIGAFGKRTYVTAIDPSTNTITVGGAPDLMGSTLAASGVNLVSVAAVADGTGVSAQVRYRDEAAPAVLTNDGEGRIRLRFSEPKRAITPGQSVVFYDGDVLLGGGLIDRAGE